MILVNTNIKEYLKHYVTTKNPQYAVMINGKWGSGKTFFIKNLIEEWNDENKEQEKSINLKPIYISLNGLSEVNQVTLKIKQFLNPILYSKGVKVAKKLFLGTLKSVVHINLDIDGDGEPDGKMSFNIDSTGLLKNDDPKIKGQKVLIFDDLERCEIPIKEIFGYINEFVEHYKCKVVILTDEPKVEKAPSEDDNGLTYKDFKEKLIGQTLTLKVELDKALKTFIDSSESDIIKQHADLIKQVFNASGIQNLRILKQSLLDFHRFLFQIDEQLKQHEKYSAFSKNLLGHFLLVYLEYKSGNHEISSLEDISFTDEENKSETKIKSKYDLILDKNDVYHRISVIRYKSILDFLKNGFCDKDNLNQELKHNGFFRGEAEEDWERLWYWEILSDDEFDIIYKNVSAKFQNEKYVNPYKLLHIVTTFFSLIDSGIISESRADIMESFKKQIIKIFQNNKKEIFSFIGDHSFSKAYHGSDSSEFKTLKKFLNDKIVEHNRSNKDDYLKKLFEEINDNSVNTLADKLKAPTPDRSTTYNRIPILVTVDGEVLGEKLLDLKPKNLQLFFSFIRERYFPEDIYSNGYLEPFHAEDRECFIAVKDLFTKKLESLRRVKRFNITKYIKLLNQLIDKLEKLESDHDG